jgi:hypothetical protein
VPSTSAIEICDSGGAHVTTLQQWVVGKKVRLQVLSQPRGATLTNIHWTIPGTTVGSYTRSLSSGSSRPIASLTGASIDFYWIDGTFAGQDQTVQVSATANGRQLTASAQFKVFKPRVDLFRLNTSGRAIMDTATAGGATVVMMIAEGGHSVPGLRGEATVTAPEGFAGEIGVTQLINLNHYLQDSTGAQFNRATSGGRFVLDDVYGVIYNKAAGETTGPRDTGVSSGSLPAGMHQDSPSVFLCSISSLQAGTPTMSGRTVASGHGQDAFKCYLMFKPTAADSIWVTLSYAEWSWQGAWDAARQLSGGYGGQDPVVLGSTSATATGRTSHDLPTWSGRAEPLFGR